MANILTAVKEGIQLYWDKVIMLIHEQKLSICNVSFHFKVNCIANELLKRVYTFFRRNCF
jgi:hypothetical protein